MDDFSFDTDIFAEINDMEGEIFDIPEMQDEKKFDVEGYINGNIDYWHLVCASRLSGTGGVDLPSKCCIVVSSSKKRNETHHAWGCRQTEDNRFHRLWQTWHK